MSYMPNVKILQPMREIVAMLRAGSAMGNFL
jgi:hypothetical protein